MSILTQPRRLAVMVCITRVWLTGPGPRLVLHADCPPQANQPQPTVTPPPAAQDS